MITASPSPSPRVRRRWSPARCRPTSIRSRRAVGDDTALAGIQRLVADAQASRSRAQALADRFAALLFYVAVAAEVTTFIVWSPLGDVDDAIVRTVTVLVIGCPMPSGWRSRGDPCRRPWRPTPPSSRYELARAGHHRGLVWTNRTHQEPHVETGPDLRPMESEMPTGRRLESAASTRSPRRSWHAAKDRGEVAIGHRVPSAHRTWGGGDDRRRPSRRRRPGVVGEQSVPEFGIRRGIFREAADRVRGSIANASRNVSRGHDPSHSEGAMWRSSPAASPDRPRRTTPAGVRSRGASSESRPSPSCSSAVPVGTSATEYTTAPPSPGRCRSGAQYPSTWPSDQPVSCWMIHARGGDPPVAGEHRKMIENWRGRPATTSSPSRWQRAPRRRDPLHAVGASC